MLCYRYATKIKNPPLGSRREGDFFVSSIRLFRHESDLISVLRQPPAFVQAPPRRDDEPTISFRFPVGMSPDTAQSREHSIRAWTRSPCGQRKFSSSSGIGSGMVSLLFWKGGYGIGSRVAISNDWLRSGLLPSIQAATACPPSRSRNCSCSVPSARRTAHPPRARAMPSSYPSLAI